MGKLADRSKVLYLKKHGAKDFFVGVYKTTFLYLRVERVRTD